MDSWKAYPLIRCTLLVVPLFTVMLGCQNSTAGKKSEPTTPMTSAVPTTNSIQAGKWQPGHYVYVADQAITPDFILDHFKGVQKSYTWKELEPEKGTYDFSLIQKDIDFLSKNGKYLVIQLDYKTYKQGLTIAPDYIKGDAYGGSPFTSVQGALNPVIWNSNVVDRFDGLIRALGKQFDDNPYIPVLPPTHRHSHAGRSRSVCQLLNSLKKTSQSKAGAKYGSDHIGR